MIVEIKEILEQLLNGGAKTAQAVIALHETIEGLQDTAHKQAELSLVMAKRIKALEEQVARMSAPNANTMYGLPLKG